MKSCPSYQILFANDIQLAAQCKNYIIVDLLRGKMCLSRIVVCFDSEPGLSTTLLKHQAIKKPELKSTKIKMSIAKFPEEVLLKIFSFLPWTDLVSVRKTCRRWKELSEDNILLRNLARQLAERWDNEDHHPSSDETSFAVLLGI